VWIIPLFAVLLGLWMAWRFYSAKGPEIVVRFESAEGIIAGKTPVLCRSVPVGIVTRIALSNDLNVVLVTVDINRDAADLLAEDSQIWVVRARYSAAGISGLSTLISGNYLGLQPGVSKNRRRDFIGLENPPAGSAAADWLYALGFAAAPPTYRIERNGGTFRTANPR